MNIRNLASLILAASVFAGPALGQGRDAGDPAVQSDKSYQADIAPTQTAPKPPKTALAKDMDKISKAMRKLKKQVKDSTQNDASLALVATIRDAAVAASNETPAWTADQPWADRPKFVSDYQAEMKKLIDAVDQLGAALKANDNVTAASLYAQLPHLEKEGHKQFRKPDDD